VSGKHQANLTRCPRTVKAVWQPSAITRIFPLSMTTLQHQLAATA
jgi:hypothetical protein